MHDLLVSDAAANLRRLMVRDGLTLDQVVARSGLDERTVRGIHAGTSRPQARTLHRLAAGLGVSSDELLQDRWQWSCGQFDRRTNPAVDEALAHEPDLFRGWTAAEFEALYGQFGAGGSLTVDGALAAARGINARRAVHDQVALLLESDQAALLTSLVEVLYQRIQVPPLAAAGARRPGPRLHRSRQRGGPPDHTPLEPHS
jgi:transcriptional regulator with XRE-family HTH domain